MKDKLQDMIKLLKSAGAKLGSVRETWHLILLKCSNQELAEDAKLRTGRLP